MNTGVCHAKLCHNHLFANVFIKKGTNDWYINVSISCEMPRIFEKIKLCMQHYLFTIPYPDLLFIIFSRLGPLELCHYSVSAVRRLSCAVSSHISETVEDLFLSFDIDVC